MLDKGIKEELKKQFASLTGTVTLVVFTQELECHFCEDTRNLAREVADLSKNISLEIYDFQKNKDKVDAYGIDKIPAIAVIGEKDYGIRFYGVPGGYEFTSLIEGIKILSSREIGLSDATKTFLDSLEKDVHIQVFVTPTCPYCPMAVILAHKCAAYSDKVRSDMVEITEFPHLAMKYEVQGVPRTVINETVAQAGAAPEQLLVQKIKEAVQ
jgi:glutaredoxin-like protein